MVIKGGGTVFFYQENIPVRFLGAYNLSRDKGFIYTERKSYYSLSIRVKGHAEFTLDNQKLTAKRGEIVLIPPNIVYSQYTAGEQILAVHFDSLKHFNADTISKQNVTDWDTVRSIFEQMYICHTEKPKGWYYKASALLYELLCIIHMETDALESKKPDSIDDAASYLDEHYTDHNLTVAALAEISGYTEAYFRRLFLSRFGITPSERINYLRIERAKRMLEAHSHTMSEIAEYIGIEDSKYFSTWFKKHTGFSPRDYLNQLGG